MSCALLRACCISAMLMAARGDNPGVTASFSQAGANYLMSVAIPFIEKEIDNIKDGFDISVKNIGCQGFTVGSYSANMAGSVGITLGGIGVQCSGDWSFKLHIWPHIPDGSGSVKITVSQTTANVAVGITASGPIPVLSAQSVSLNIGNLDMSFSGSLWDWLLDLLKGLLSDSVKSAVTSAFTSEVTKFINTDANQILAQIKYEIPVPIRAPYNITEIRFGLTGNPVMNTTYIGVGVQGDIVPIANPVAPPLPPPALPVFDSSAATNYLQMHLSPYTLLSGAYAYLQAGLLTWLLPPNDLPLGFNNTAGYTLVAPGFPAAYPNAAVSMDVIISGMPTFVIRPAPTGIVASAPINFDFQVAAANGSVVTAFTVASVTNAALVLSIGHAPNTGEQAILGQLEYLNSNLTLLHTDVGPVNVGLMQAAVDLVFTGVLIPVVNALLASGIPLPSLAGLTLTDTTLTLGTDNLMLATDFTISF